MKKTISLLLIVSCLVVSCCCLVACTDGASEPVTHTVSFYIGTTCVGVASVTEGEVIGEYKVEYGNYYNTAGHYSWYTTKTGTIEWNLYKDTVDCDMSLFGRVSAEA